MNKHINTFETAGSDSSGPTVDRRQLVAGGAAALLGATAISGGAQAQEKEPAPLTAYVRQSVMGWCFKPMSPTELAKFGKEIGLLGIEGIDSKYYPEVKKLGLEISLVGSHGFAKGPLDPENHAEVESKLKKSIDTAVEFKSPSVITFTGMSKKGISEKQAMANCLASWKRVISYAEEKGITLVLEHLNSRDDSHPMKGHPGYFGDDVELCLDLVKQMDSPNFKLLFDVYHVQVMNGDVIRRIREMHPWIGHYHTAGNPGRCELDENQEINYPPIMKAILETGYTGFVAQEFIPTWDDPKKSLEHAFRVCDV